MNQLPTPPDHERAASSPPHDAAGGRAVDQLDTELADLRGLPLAELRTLDDSVLAHSLRRVVEEARSADIVVAGHSVSV